MYAFDSKFFGILWVDAVIGLLQNGMNNFCGNILTNFLTFLLITGNALKT